MKSESILMKFNKPIGPPLINIWFHIRVKPSRREECVLKIYIN